ncbi:MAG TPA: bifunctional phosphoribosyl-AMP cyclohydrolase/phosphoribosyl-ATP diphosphatase HisIE [Blastocatellia bacterium]|nr:bifunctional phosphoribosyl-AMP cyclohydrolase/phosphoribosyl-ATP diphosphatase HisIE [Blastocatellia bacterium]
MEIEKIEFDERGLVPAVVQDSTTGDVLMLAYMNAESLARTLQTGETWFWNRTHNELWHKGTASGHRQRVVELRLDCDGDAIVVRVDTDGPACHTGERSCFFRPLAGEAPAKKTNGSLVSVPERPEPTLSVVDMNSMELGILLNDLYTLIRLREAERPENSYTSYLFDSGLDKILKKIGEEATETVIAAKNGSARELTSEMADLLYHLLVLMVERGLGLQDICRELADRAGKSADPRYAARTREE